MANNSKNIKGIIVEIGGDTSALEKSLKDVNKSSASLTRELRDVTKLLKFNPKDIEIATQKQDLLKRQITETSSKLNALTEAQLEYENAGKDLNTENYRALIREIAETQNQLNSAKEELENFRIIGNRAFEEVGAKIVSVGDKIENVGSKISSVGGKLTTTVTLPMIAAGAAAINYSGDIEQLETSFTVMTGSANKAKQIVSDLKKEGASTPYSLKGLAENTQLLMQYNFNADEAIETTKLIGDVSQGSAEKMQSITTGYAQMTSAQKVNLQDIKQMINGGFNPLAEISERTGESMGSLYDRISKGNMAVEEITESLKNATSEGGKFYKSSEKQSQTLKGQISTLKDETADLSAELVKSLMPSAKKVVAEGTKFVKKLNEMSDSEKKNVLQIGLFLAAAGPTIKVVGSLTSAFGKGVKAVGTMSQTIGVLKSGIASTNATANTLANTIKLVANPTALISAGIIAGFTAAVVAVEKAEECVRKSSEKIGKSASEYVTGISTAKSHLDEFNSTLFASNEEQEELSNNMQEIQANITAICKTASEERREYTAEEITQLDDYFNKLNELNAKQLEIQQSVADAISFQAVQEAESFSGSLEEYKVKSQEWINTANQQKEKTLQLIEQQTIEEVALLRSRYGEKADLSNAEYAAEYQTLMEKKQQRIDVANSEVAEIVQAYSNGYSVRSAQENGFYSQLESYRNQVEQLESEHNEKIRQIKDGEVVVFGDKYGAIEVANNTYVGNRKKAIQNLYKNMSEEQQEELGIWMAQLAQTELYGGSISEENQRMVDAILQSYEYMPDKTRNAMKNAMSPMLTEMQNAEPGLYAKASQIANGIISRIRTTFQIHSPSRVMKGISINVIKGSEIGIEKEKVNLMNDVDELGYDLKNKFENIGHIDMNKIQASVSDRTRNVVDFSGINSSALNPEILETAFTNALKKMNLKVMVDKDVLGEIATNEVNKNFGSVW